jgi:hypothetical protein
MGRKEIDEPSSLVDSIEEQEALRKAFMTRWDCRNCPFRKTTSARRVSECYRCFEKFRKAMTSLPVKGT